jgi:hypothetical protein
MAHAVPAKSTQKQARPRINATTANAHSRAVLGRKKEVPWSCAIAQCMDAR